MDLVKALSDKYVKADQPEINVGDTVRVSVKVKEGNRRESSGLKVLLSRRSTAALTKPSQYAFPTT